MSSLVVRDVVFHMFDANFLLNRSSLSMLLLLVFCSGLTYHDDVVVLLPVVVPFSCCQVVVLQLIVVHILVANFVDEHFLGSMFETELTALIPDLMSLPSCRCCCCCHLGDLPWGHRGLLLVGH